MASGEIKIFGKFVSGALNTGDQILADAKQVKTNMVLPADKYPYGTVEDALNYLLTNAGTGSGSSDSHDPISAGEITALMTNNGMITSNS